MRIITGIARGARLETLEGEHTRPTTEKVKEAIFSMIQFDIEGRRVLDLFSGSGQMALEALSRGAAFAVMVDNSIDAVNIIKRNAQKVKLYEKTRILHADYAQYIRSAAGREKFHIIFADPPYGDKLIPEVVKKLLNAGLIAENGILVCESDEPQPFETDRLRLHRHYRYGKIYVTVYINDLAAQEDGEEDGRREASGDADGEGKEGK